MNLKEWIFKKMSSGVLLLGLSGVAYGASIDHIQNYTPEYNANPAQQGAVNPGTSQYYNPAGLMQIENGRYFQIGAQLATGREEMKYRGDTYDADLMDIIPNISYSDKNDRRAWYWTLGGIAGGGYLEYDNGVPGLEMVAPIMESVPGVKDAQLTENSDEGGNHYIQTTLGRAWFITEKVSVSAAGRVVYGERTLKTKFAGDLTSVTGRTQHLEGSIDSERTAWGYGGVFGLNYRATENLNIGMRYDTKINMNFEADADEETADIRLPGPGNITLPLGVSTFFPQYGDGNRSRRDLPAILALGASYRVTDVWTVFAGGNYYFNKDAKLDDDYTHGKYDNGWEVSLGSEYLITSKVAWMTGANYAVTGADEDTYSDIEFALDSFMLGTGLKYRENDTTTWVVSVSHYWYSAADGTDYSDTPALGEEDTVRYNKEVTAFGVSLTKRF